MTTFAPAEVEVEEPLGADDPEHDRPWVVIVWNDPINLMSYVTLVFQKLFGYTLDHARGAPQRQVGRVVGRPREGRAGRRPPPRLRTLGDHATGLVSFPSRVERTPAGDIRLHLADDERAVLREVADELGSLLEEAPDDPSLRRLFPTAHDDEELEREYRELTRGQLDAGRERSIETLRETAGRELLTPGEADALLRALNDARLVLGTRLDITEDFDWEAFDASDPRAPEIALYAYLSWIQEQLVEAM
jgi:uncharacterized protein DUF2017/ATP-dependent Clp protease adaptor protein ClpS